MYRIKRPTSVGLLSRGKDYSVKDLGGSPQGYTNLLAKELGVSLDATSPQVRWTHLHELGHVRESKWSPERIQKTVRKRTGRTLPVPTILAAEDVRVNELVTRRVPDAHAGFRLTSPPHMLRQDLTGYAASHASPSEIADAIRPSCNPAHVAAVDAFLRRVRAMSTDELTVMRVTVPLATVLADLMEGGEPQQGEGDGKGKGEPGDGKGEGGSESDEDALGEPDAHESDQVCGGGLPPSGGDGKAREWVIPEVVEPALTVAHKGRNAATATAETGTQIRWSQAHRMSTDGVMFRRARRKPGALQRGTVLIDGSGSMSLSNEHIDALVTTLPHATIVVYSSSDVGSRKRGYIVVVARDGKRVADIASIPRGGDNGCDGPALLWLSRQAAPRLWVCDGLVTEANFAKTAWAVAECDAIMRAAGIIQVSGSEGTYVATRRHREGRMYGIDIEGFRAVLRDVERGRIAD